VHEWALAELEEAGDWTMNYTNVEQYMTTQLFTVQEDELLEMVAFLMDRKQIRHVPVEDEERSPEAGRILMPLYQEQGEDGFFIVRSFHPVWLRVSSMLRHLHFDHIVHWLPGARRHPDRPGSLVANKLVARWYALEVLHLLGYRKQAEEEGWLVVDRRGETATQ